MSQFLIEHWVSLVFGLISIAIVAYCRHLSVKFKNYKIILEKQLEEEFEALIEKKLKDIKDKFVIYDRYFEAIRHSYRFRLLTLCEKYLARGYITPKEYSLLSEMWTVYHGLDGNGQGEDFYHKVELLPIRDHDDKNKGNS